LGHKSLATTERYLRLNITDLKEVVREQEQFRALLELLSPTALVDVVAREIRSRGLLPRQEVHDSLILAEAALLGCELLPTSDEPLRGIDHEHLTLVLNPFELVPPVIASPREIVSGVRSTCFVAGARRILS
jgi:hypothetical protein